MASKKCDKMCVQMSAKGYRILTRKMQDRLNERFVELGGDLSCFNKCLSEKETDKVINKVLKEEGIMCTNNS